MKKLMTVLAIFLVTSSYAFSKDDASVPVRIKSSFETKYTNAMNVKWRKVNDVYVGSFNEEGKNFEVYYSEIGDLLGSARYISESYLPQLVADAVSNRFPGDAITQLLELTSIENGTTYFVGVENSKATSYACVYSDGKVELLKKVKK